MLFACSPPRPRVFNWSCLIVCGFLVSCYIYIYIYIYTHTYIHTYIHISLSLSLFLCMYISLSLYIYIYSCCCLVCLLPPPSSFSFVNLVFMLCCYIAVSFLALCDFNSWYIIIIIIINAIIITELLCLFACTPPRPPRFQCVTYYRCWCYCFEL